MWDMYKCIRFDRRMGMARRFGNQLTSYWLVTLGHLYIWITILDRE